MKYPTLFELLRQEPLEVYNAQKLKYPAIAENFYNALSDKYII
jgi:hypothetical protein